MIKECQISNVSVTYKARLDRRTGTEALVTGTKGHVYLCASKSMRYVEVLQQRTEGFILVSCKSLRSLQSWKLKKWVLLIGQGWVIDHCIWFWNQPPTCHLNQTVAASIGQDVILS